MTNAYWALPQSSSHLNCPAAEGRRDKCWNWECKRATQEAGIQLKIVSVFLDVQLNEVLVNSVCPLAVRGPLAVRRYEKEPWLHAELFSMFRTRVVEQEQYVELAVARMVYALYRIVGAETNRVDSRIRSL